ncbi:MAG TPA: response regulator transcription factor [Stackebrandtia sp.]|uniref:response regulator transcription factor n=1 Tax=Stackebrandtia sp. TaxID=2023065 RepID=UPI002D3B14AB|nr:response regulator transcription factor [Stackebrandtia sp.]HZE39429.1 response regulator transcription factor [Stackebrandtia sp.]
MIRVMIVDDHPVVRFGLRGMLESAEGVEVCGEAASGPEALAAAPGAAPDVILMDLRMPDGDGLDAIAALVRHARVIVLTTYEDDGDIARAIGSGAAGYLLKDTPRATLLEAITAADTTGRARLSPSVTRRLTSHSKSRTLSERETEVLRLVSRGLSNPEIGGELYIAESTVKTYLLRIFAKLEVSDRTAAVTTALERGLL